MLSGSEGLLETVGPEVATEGVRVGTHSQSRRERVPDCMSRDTEILCTERSADKRDGKQIGI